jgi:hypothetical protein
MLRVMASILCILALAGCVRNEPPQIKDFRQVEHVAPKSPAVITRVVRVETPACPSDDYLKDVAIEVSKATYRNSTASGSKACACPDDHYLRLGVALPCNGVSAIKPATWVMCSRDQVPPDLISTMRAKFENCSQQIQHPSVNTGTRP